MAMMRWGLYYLLVLLGMAVLVGVARSLGWVTG